MYAPFEMLWEPLIRHMDEHFIRNTCFSKYDWLCEQRGNSIASYDARIIQNKNNI